MNNYAICAMYTCELALAVNTLESLIRENPAAHMCDVVVFNLSTLYELSCDNKLQVRKKRVLQQVVEELQLTGLIPVLWLEQVMVEQVEAEVQVGVQDEMLVVVVLAVGLVVRQIAEVQQAVVAAVAAPKAAVVVTELLL